jgi:hypothetical protein
MTCPQCSKPVPEDVRFCPFCGVSLNLRDVGSQGAQAASEVRAQLTVSKVPADARCAIHLDHPAIDTCTRCGNFVCESCRVVSSTGVIFCINCQQRGEVDTWRVPWERRAEIGFFRAYWQTCKGVMVNPGTCFGGLAPETGRWWDPLSFAIVSLYAGSIGMAVMYGLIFGIGGIAAALDKTPKGSDAAFGALGFGVGAVLLVLAFLVFVPISALISAFVWGGVDHLMLKLVGVKTRGYEATVRGMCYAQGPMIFGLLPVCGYYVGLIWAVVCRIFAYRGVHKTTGGRSSAAVLIPMGLCCVSIVGLYGVAIAAAIMSGPGLK